MRARVPLAILGLLGSLPAWAAEVVPPRDPFEFGPREAQAGPQTPVLVGVLWDASRPLAIIDDREASTGDVITGWRITAIQPDGIRIERSGRLEFLTPGTAFPPD